MRYTVLLFLRRILANCLAVSKYDGRDALSLPDSAFRVGDLFLCYRIARLDFRLGIQKIIKCLELYLRLPVPSHTYVHQ